MSILFSATYPDRTRGLVLIGSLSCGCSRRPDWPYGWRRERFEEALEEMSEHWGQGGLMNLFLPGLVDDERARRLWARYQRMGGSPGTARALMEANARSTCACSAHPGSDARHPPHGRARRARGQRPLRRRAHPGCPCSSSRMKTTCRGSATLMACSTRSRSSSPAAATMSTRTGSSPPFCSPTSSTPRARRGGGRPALARAARRS